MSVPVVSDVERVAASGLERLVFGHRAWFLLICAVITLFLGHAATRATLRASFEAMAPKTHEFMANYRRHHADLSARANVVRIGVEAGGETILDAKYLDTLRRINDAVFLIPGVDRAQLKSIWTPTTRWSAVTEDGLDGGPVMPEDYDGSPVSIRRLRLNLERSNEIGQIIAPDFRSSVVYVPLVDPGADRTSGIDYPRVAADLERLRARFEAEGVRLHITGFAKVIGDLNEGLRAMLGFLGVAVVVTMIAVYRYTRCPRSTLLVVTCSLLAVLWQLGAITLLGYALDPYSVLAPFLTFAIGMSHGAQKMNGILQDVGRGWDRLKAARMTFRRLFLPGLTALACDAVGFAAFAVIDIQAIQDLAVVASLGIAILGVTNLLLLPVLLSGFGVSSAAAQRSLREQDLAPGGRFWHALASLTTPRRAHATVLAFALLAAIGAGVSARLQVGDLDEGAPELRVDSRYNRDNAFMIAHYGASSDVFVVMVETAPSSCASAQTLERVDALEWALRQLPGVQATQSLATLSRFAFVGLNEGQARWGDVLVNDRMLAGIQVGAPPDQVNRSCSLLPITVYLRDHRAETLNAVVDAARQFAATADSPGFRVALAAGNAGIDAATNSVVRRALTEMMIWVYGAVALFCLVTFRSWRAVVVALVPLVITTWLCEALMVVLGIGVKVATLPVIALGVGIGVDYALYILSVTLVHLRQGRSLRESYLQALHFTGRVVLMTGTTLAFAVLLWVFSPIKFQADMGLLLAFMFLWNMLGALLLVPALAHVLRLKPRSVAETAPAAEASTVDA